MIVSNKEKKKAVPLLKRGKCVFLNGMVGMLDYLLGKKLIQFPKESNALAKNPVSYKKKESSASLKEEENDISSQILT